MTINAEGKMMNAELKKFNKKVVRASQSPLNKLQWICELECGHEQWVTASRRPKVYSCGSCAKAEHAALKAAMK